MKSCVACGGSRFATRPVERKLKIGATTFVLRVKASTCVGCGEHFFAASELEKMELAVAMKLADLGLRSGAAIRFMRKAIALSATELAELLDVTKETVSRWENGHVAADARAFAVLGDMVADRLVGRTDTRDRLRSLQHPSRARRVELAVG